MSNWVVDTNKHVCTCICPYNVPPTVVYDSLPLVILFVFGNIKFIAPKKEIKLAFQRGRTSISQPLLKVFASDNIHINQNIWLKELCDKHLCQAHASHGVWIKLGQAENDSFSREVKVIIKLLPSPMSPSFLPSHAFPPLSLHCPNPQLYASVGNEFLIS